MAKSRKNPPRRRTAAGAGNRRGAAGDGGAQAAHPGAADGGRLLDILRMWKTSTVRRVRQISADMLASREVDPPAGFVQLQIARLRA